MVKKEETPIAAAEATDTPAIEAGNRDAPTAEEPVPTPAAVTYETTAVETAPLEGQAVTDETPAAETPTKWLCPKDGSAMQPMGRRGRGAAWRCPTCRGIFFDVETVRRNRQGRPPVWAPVVFSIVMSVLITLIVRQLKSRSKS